MLLRKDKTFTLDKYIFEVETNQSSNNLVEELKKLNERLKMLEGEKKNIESVMDESEKLKKYH